MVAALNKMSLVEQSQISDNSDEIKSTLRGLLDAKELTLRDISKFTGFASPTVSQVLSGQYEGDIGKLEDALARFYRNWVASNLIIETSVVKQIHGTMGLAWKRKLICRITGHFGCGKSKASARYVALNSDTSAYVELVSTTTPTSLMHRIAEALNIESQMSGSQDDKLSAIIRNLQRKPRQLVIDEADNLKARTLAILKDIHGGEEAGRCSIVLLGTERLKTLLRDPVLGYLRRRITLQCEVGDISFDEAKLIMDFWPNKLDGEDLKEAWGRALKIYGVATMVAIMARAFDMAQYHGKKFIDDKCLAEAYDMVLN
jgi:DNA transposition AAA+ family ATPase